MKKTLKSLASLVIVLAFFSVCFYTASSKLDFLDNSPVNSYVKKKDGITVHFFDVGQGDCEFVEFPNGECMIIDASTDSYSETIISKVENLGYSKIDYAVATHPHDDHIGALDNVVEHFEIGEFYMPDVSTSSKCYNDLITVLNEKNIEVSTAESGVTILNGGDLLVEILSPADKTYSDSNDYSAVVKITYKDNSFIFMGDAQSTVENQLVDNYGDYIDADVLKVGHHGSSSSSSEEFLSAVTPKYAVISCGEDNPYDHPNEDAVNRLEKSGAEIYCTDECSSIAVNCDGSDNFDITFE